MNHPLILLAAGFLAGAMNAAAGGGSFVTLPALVFAGVPSVGANTSSTVALFPGSLASAWAYREELQAFGQASGGTLPLRKMLIVSVLGSTLGALLLLLTPSSAFDAIVPWLLLIGTLAFALGPNASVMLRKRIQIAPAAGAWAQFLLGIYGGYFGGAVGLMMMAAWSMLGLSDIKQMNAAKTLLVGATNSIAVICFIIADKVWWPETSLMLGAAVAGGYIGARIARRLNPRHIRLGITIMNVVMTAIFFYRANQ
jgi:uncharacterized membrane protein YfcA